MHGPTDTADDVATFAWPSDAMIIVRSRDEPESFALLFRRHAAPLQRYIARRVGPVVAEDVLADVFLAAFRQRHRYDPDREDARPWLYGIATNLVGRHRRAEVRALRNLERTGIDPVTEAFVERSDARVGAAAVRQRLAAALAALRPGYRDALLLVAWGQLTYEEVAAALDIPVGTVRSRVNRARSSMRTALGGVDPTSIQKELP
jgi:RNA polymerase sigma-70 factor (ECF subfamily)